MPRQAKLRKKKVGSNSYWFTKAGGDTYFGSVLKLAYFFNGEGIELLRVPAASTDGDSVVHFRGSDIVASTTAGI